jgi:hypothetical protein
MAGVAAGQVRWRAGADRREGSVANIASEGLFARMDTLVFIQISSLGKEFVAQVTGIRLLAEYVCAPSLHILHCTPT